MSRLLELILPVCFGLLGFICCQDDGPVVLTADGLLQGLSRQDRFNRTYDAFFGVPFAQPPVGELRWKPSQRPVESWTGIRNATEFAPHCIQIGVQTYDDLGIGTNESEDCLYLNLYVPVSVDDALGKNLPVMFFFYGGGFLTGTAELFPGQELATDANVVVIITTYRTSVMGFMSTADSACPGNYGLWDGKAALEWTLENIAAFGGNPNDITVFGHSAGAGMTMHLTLSPQTNTMFQKAISISGSTAGSTSFTMDPMRSTQHLADLFFCNTTDTAEILACLMEVDAKTLDTMGLLSIRFNESRIPDFLPVIDGTFVTQDTRKSIEEGVNSHLPLLTGHTYHDGAGLALELPLGNPPPPSANSTNDTYDGNNSSQDIHDYLVVLFGDAEDPEGLYEILVDRYPDLNSTDNELCSRAATTILTYYIFSATVHYEAYHHARTSVGGVGTYVYRFEYRQSFLTGYPDWVNGSHMDDLYCVFGDPFMRYFRENSLETDDFTPDDEQVGQNVRGRFANFAYTGNPNTGPVPEAVAWPDYGNIGEFLVQSTEERLVTLTEEEKEEIDWFLFVWWPLLKPIWAEPSETFEEFPNERRQFDEQEFLKSVEESRRHLYSQVGWQEDLMRIIDDRIDSALLERETYRR